MVGRHLIRPFIVVCYGRLLETNPGLARPGRDMPSIQQYIKPKSYPSHISTAKYSFQKMYRQRQYVMIIPIIKRLFVWDLLTKLFTFHMFQFVRREKRKRQTDRQKREGENRCFASWPIQQCYFWSHQCKFYPMTMLLYIVLYIVLILFNHEYLNSMVHGRVLLIL